MVCDRERLRLNTVVEESPDASIKSNKARGHILSSRNPNYREIYERDIIAIAPSATIKMLKLYLAKRVEDEDKGKSRFIDSGLYWLIQKGFRNYCNESHRDTTLSPFCRKSKHRD